MRESTGGAYLMYIAIFFASAVMFMFVSAISYNKAFKAKNHIIETIEKYGKFEADTDINSAEGKIVEYLKQIGYQRTDSGKSGRLQCGSPSYTWSVWNQNYVGDVSKSSIDKFDYCVYKYATDGKVYYKVVTYTSFDFPFIGNIFKYTVYGETKLLDGE